MRRAFKLARLSAFCGFAVCAFVAPAGAALAQPPASTQTPAPVLTITFTDAVLRAIEKNPSSAIAAAGILRAEGILYEARSALRPQVNGNITETTLNKGISFQGLTVTPQNSITGTLNAQMALFAPAAWALRVQAMDQEAIVRLNVADVNRQTALAAADAYLTILARRRVVDANQRAHDTAQAHFQLAQQLEQGGTGSRLNSLRAQQELSTDEGLVEAAKLGLYEAQEALGVLLVADGPVDAADEPTFEAASVDATSGYSRTDLRLFMARQDAAARVLRDTRKEYFPSLEAIFQPQATRPAPLFSPANSWRFLLEASIPILDGGFKAGEKLTRQSDLDVAGATLAGAMTSISSEVRAAREAVASAERILTSVNASAMEAQQVVNIVNISFRAGASTNIEVIDAQRSARDADTAVAIAEDTVRRARLDLLNALGRFP